MDVRSTLPPTAQSGDCLDAKLESVAIARLIEEVRSTAFEVTRAYNRTYNRHNR
ncbi:MAG TPA: YhhA family cyclophane-containing RiPP [Allosphingosinicella sp.]|nr:YhhA family cyclophane-containing RiPP [Allosphingosinicella sp.]